MCDVDLDGIRVLVRRAFSDDEVLTPKSTHERVVPLYPEVREILVDVMRRKLPHARVVLNERGLTRGARADEQLVQQGRGSADVPVDVVMMTHETKESAIQGALSALGASDFVAKPPRMIRVH